MLVSTATGGVSAASTPSPQCLLDEAVLNHGTVHSLTNMGLSIFAVLCGKNRGAFVLPGINATYSCLNLPPSFREQAQLTSNITMATSNDIQNELTVGNITGHEAISLLSQLNKAFFESTDEPEADVFACNLNGLSKLSCPSITNDNDGLLTETVRAATMAGVLVPFLGSPATYDWYGTNDFTDMRTAGLNTVVIPAPLDLFDEDEDKTLRDDLDRMLDMAYQADLYVILELVDTKSNHHHHHHHHHGDDDIEDAVHHAAKYAVKHNLLALQVPTRSSVLTARKVSSTLPLLMPVTAGELVHLQDYQDEFLHKDEPDKYLYAAYSLVHDRTVADVASSSSAEDRVKMFYHESLACMQRAPLEYGPCYQPSSIAGVFVSSGFDLAVDDCAHATHADYGQCGRFDETIHSPWWQAHRRSLAERQLFAMEHGAGWTFAAWKVPSTDAGAVATPLQLYALQSVLEAGLFPDLTDDDTLSSACLNPPAADFVLGDATLSPTPGPPPDCGNGWWNATIQGCSYWVPPPPCPVCSSADGTDTTTAVDENTTTTAQAAPGMVWTTLAVGLTELSSNDNNHDSPLSLTFAVGGLVVVAMLVGLFMNGRIHRGNGGYQTIPH